ncbi:MAG: type II toxin-antitoxin system RelE/ParE family toxin [Deltaproteobacteria bacterium]|nr:type II toxin-antitoxin system RelE/ParE family toxin [Deltaproteobacteria bacterium]
MIKVLASNQVLKFKKRASSKFQLEIDKQVKTIMENPEIGELKKGDLKGLRVLKFNYNRQLYLLSYEMKGSVLNLYLIGSYENFYLKLKKYLR